MPSLKNNPEISTTNVYFVGAGPGDPELITVKGQKLISAADVILYAGSLVSTEILKYAPEGADFHNSAGMKLGQQVALMSEAVGQGKLVVRLHTGDPSIYGAIAEQMKALDELNIPYRVIPGVSSAFAAAAALAIELTIPELTQTIILTRLLGRTNVPDTETLSELAAHKTSLMIFLSTGMIERVVEELLAAGYSPETPIAVVYRVTWPDEVIIQGILEDIAKKVLEAELTHHALIVVSPALGQKTRSDSAVSHLYGIAQERAARKDATAIVALTRQSVRTGKAILDALPDSLLFAPERFAREFGMNDRIHPTITSVRETLQSAFKDYSALVGVMASGIVVREIAPLLKSKHVDPAVVVVDEKGCHAISLLGGHKGGANLLAQNIAQILGGKAVITTSSDTQNLPALDLLEKEHAWVLESRHNLTAVSAAMVNGEMLGIFQDCGSRDWLPAELPENFKLLGTFEELMSSSIKHVICITYREIADQLRQTDKIPLIFHSACLHVGIGCNRGTPKDEIWRAIEDTFASSGLCTHSIASLGTVMQKADEPGILESSELQRLPLKIFSPQQLSAVNDLPNPSFYAKKAVGAPGVAEPAALLAAGAGELLVEKRKYPNVTVAVALEESGR